MSHSRLVPPTSTFPQGSALSPSGDVLSCWSSGISLLGISVGFTETGAFPALQEQL